MGKRQSLKQIVRANNIHVLKNKTGPLSYTIHKSSLKMVAHTYNPSTLEGQGRWITRSTDRDHPGQQGETPSLLKIQKLAGHGGVCL